MLTDYVLQVPQTVYGGLHALENIPKAIKGAKKGYACPFCFLFIRASLRLLNYSMIMPSMFNSAWVFTS